MIQYTTNDNGQVVTITLRQAGPRWVAEMDYWSAKDHELWDKRITATIKKHSGNPLAMFGKEAMNLLLRHLESGKSKYELRTHGGLPVIKKKHFSHN